MLKQSFLLAGLTFALTANAAVITADDNVGTPLATGSVQFFTGIVPASTTFAYSVHFTTDGMAALGSGAVIGLDLDGVSGFVGPLTISLYQDNYTSGEFTDSLALVSSAIGTNLSNIPVLANTQYSFVIEGVTDTTPNNAFSGSVSISGVPVPASAWLFGSALLAVASIGRTRKS